MALDLMQIATYIPWLALVVSALSLTMSIRNSSFSRRTKLIELKVAFLSKLSESSMANKRLHRLNQEFRKLASENDDGALMEMLDMPEIEANQNDLDDIYSRIAAAPVGAAISIYETAFHNVSQLCDRILALEDRLITEKSNYESRLTKHV
jgi:hypothetical protein